MSGTFTRRNFIGAAATAGVVTGVGLPSPAGAERALPQRRMSFDDGWRFSRGDFPGAHLPEFRDDAWNAVDLPHDWSIAGPYDEQESAGGSGGYLPTGIGWYRKTFAPPSSAAGKRVQI